MVLRFSMGCTLVWCRRFVLMAAKYSFEGLVEPMNMEWHRWGNIFLVLFISCQNQEARAFVFAMRPVYSSIQETRRQEDVEEARLCEVDNNQTEVIGE